MNQDGSLKIIKLKPSPIIEMHGIDMGKFFGQTVVRTPHSIHGAESAGSSQKKGKMIENKGGNVLMIKK